MKRTGIIYKVISPSGKVYIGKTVMSLANRKYYHIRSATKLMIDTKFCRAIRKYGAELVWEIIYDGITCSEINNLEIQIISKYNSYKVGYNSTKGGDGTVGLYPSLETRKKMSEAHKGFRHSDDAKRKISVANKNKHVGEETRLKLSLAAKKRDKWTHSRETKNKMSLSVRGRNNHMFGKHHSQETKDRMSKSSKGQKAWNKGVLHTN
ncbi:hypothetical protein LCGC14_2533800, partial [marine sediment metagenome]